MPSPDLIEQKILFEGLRLKYGYDFRNYSEASLSRRTNAILQKWHSKDPLDLLKRALRDPDFFQLILKDLIVPTTELFRDPDVFKTVREKVLPMLSTYPHLNLWVSGCSTGEEVYSLAILLKEEGLLSRTTLYATDINSHSLEIARKGVYNVRAFQAFAKNYTLAGGTCDPSDYYVASHGSVQFHSDLIENIVFAEHNLVSDASFKEMQLIFCRNVLIYFNHSLQNRVLQLFQDSLVPRGFLVLGSKESIQSSSPCLQFVMLDSRARLYQKDVHWQKDHGRVL